jgi:hypothetical protein
LSTTCSLSTSNPEPAASRPIRRASQPGSPVSPTATAPVVPASRDSRTRVAAATRRPVATSCPTVRAPHHLPIQHAVRFVPRNAPRALPPTTGSG